MKVCAEYEDQITAFNAHRTLINNGVDPEDVELRSPYPLAEHPIPPHRSRPMIMRNIVRVCWLIGLITGFSFITFTQLEWGLTAKTSGQPLVAISINAIIMYECGMITAILVTTLMFFVETRRYRQLVPPLEEDMPVANGYLALVISGEGAKKAKEALENSGARSIVTYALPLAFMSLFLSGCATYNLRYQPTIKPGEAAADAPPPESVAMPTLAQQEVKPPQPYGWFTYGNQVAFERADQERRRRVSEVRDVEGLKGGAATRREQEISAEYDDLFEEVRPKILALKVNTVPQELESVRNPVPADQVSVDRGKELYRVNCAQCHGDQGRGDGRVGELLGITPLPIGTAQYAPRSDGFLYHFIASGKNTMPSFGYKLTGREIWDIVNYLRQLQGNGGASGASISDTSSVSEAETTNEAETTSEAENADESDGGGETENVDEAEGLSEE